MSQELVPSRPSDIVESRLPQEQDAAFLALWLHGKSEKTQRAYSADMHKFYGFVGKSLQDVTLGDVQAFIDSLTGLKVSTQARCIAAVKSALSFGVKSGWLVANVGVLVKLPKAEDTLAERIMSERDMARMLAKEEHPRNHAILVLLYRAGLRAHELCNLQWRHIQPRQESGQLALFGKGRKTRFVLLDKSTWEEIQQLRPLTAVTPATYVFQSRQGKSRKGDTQHRMDESMIHRIVRRAAKRAGVSGNVSPHWMRHAHATHSLENGASITLVKDTLGHKSIETTARYTHVRPNASSGQFLKV